MVGAVPFGFSTLNLSGKFTLNKALSDDTDDILRLQGIGWLIRKAIGIASITLEIKHRKEDGGAEHLTFDEYTTTGGLSTTTEHRALSWKEAKHDDIVFGSMVVKSRRCQAEDIGDEFLTKGWTAETYKHGLVQSVIESNTKKSWTVNETNGIEEINGEKRYTRHVLFTGTQGQIIKARVVYDHSKPIR